jgi:DNA-binding transcriptional regulator LsrR (DeoR family)
VDCRADLLNQRVAFKTELPHLAGEELMKQLQLKDNIAISWGNQ